MFIHEDARRRLIEWAEGEFKVCKVVIAESDCVVGDHYHLKKDEKFLLLSGRCISATIGGAVTYDPRPPFYFDVPRGIYHRFELEKGAVLLGVATERFDKDDEIPGKPEFGSSDKTVTRNEKFFGENA